MKNAVIIAMSVLLLQCSGGNQAGSEEVPQKKQNNQLAINDLWVLESLKGKHIDPGSISEGSKAPQLEIHVGEMKYNGTDGCNNIFGGLIELDESILRFGIGAGTRMMCQEMEIPDEFNRTLPEVNNYKVDGMKLHLFDAEGKELMQFKKAGKLPVS